MDDLEKSNEACDVFNELSYLRLEDMEEQDRIRLINMLYDFSKIVRSMMEKYQDAIDENYDGIEFATNVVEGFQEYLYDREDDDDSDDI